MKKTRLKLRENKFLTAIKWLGMQSVTFSNDLEWKNAWRILIKYPPLVSAFVR